jgi:hypothetical protein
MTPPSEGRTSVRPLESAISILQLDVDRRVEDERREAKAERRLMDALDLATRLGTCDLQGHQALGAKGPIATSGRRALGLENIAGCIVGERCKQGGSAVHCFALCLIVRPAQRRSHVRDSGKEHATTGIRIHYLTAYSASTFGVYTRNW